MGVGVCVRPFAASPVVKQLRAGRSDADSLQRQVSDEAAGAKPSSPQRKPWPPEHLYRVGSSDETPHRHSSDSNSGGRGGSTEREYWGSADTVIKEEKQRRTMGRREAGTRR